jgi:hypothetical protein
MLGRGIALLSGALLLSGCMTAKVGTDYAAISQKVGPPKPGKSRVVVSSAKARRPIHGPLRLRREGGWQSDRQVLVGTYAYADVPAGPHQVTATEVLFPGETKRDFTTAQGRTYFFLVKSSARHDAVTGTTIVAGLAGAVVASVVTSGSDNTGPADLIPLDEPTARTTLAELQLAD